jgi:2-phosphoglycolate phosphatase
MRADPISGRSPTANWSPSTFLFDLDGTLVDSFEAIRASVNHVREHRGQPPLDMDTVRRAVGNGIHRLIELTAPVGDHDENVHLFTAHHTSVIDIGTRMMPGAFEVLHALRERGRRLGVCSNKPLALTRRLLEGQGALNLVEVVLGPESAPRRKPAPDMLLEAIRQLGSHVDQTVYVGDMTIDIETARAAGVTVWVIPSGTQDEATLLAAHPDRLIHQFEEVLTLAPIADM